MPSVRRRFLVRPLILATLLLAVVPLAVSDASSGSATSLALTANGRDSCTPTALAAPAGEITIVFTNPTDRDQSFGVLGVGVGQPEEVGDGASSTLTATLAAGTYTFWCGDDADDPDVMRGKLTVTTAGSGSGGGTAPPPPPPPAPPSSVEIVTSDYSFSPASFQVAAGSVTVTVRNAGQETHTWTVPGVVNVTVLPGETKTVTFTAAAGSYAFYCAAGSHAGKGMRGTMTVVASGGSAPPPPTPTPPPAPTPPPPPAGPPPPPGPLSVTSTEFAFSPSSLSAAAGTVTVTVTNAGQLAHTFTIDGLVNVEVAPGETRTVSFNAPAGSYRFYCAVSGHDGAGMAGTLVVSAPGSQPPAPVAPPPPPPPPPGHTHPAPAPAPPAGASALTVSATEFAFRPATLAAAAGSVTLTVSNDGRLPHTFTIDGVVDVEVAAGATRTVTFQASAGSYRFYCAIAGHRGAGMEGMLVVSPSGTPPPAVPPPPPPSTGTAASTPTDGHHVHIHSPAKLPRGCRPRATMVLSGTVVSSSNTALRIRVTQGNRPARHYRGGTVSLLVHAATAFTSRERSDRRELEAGDRVTAATGRCRARGRRLIAIRVLVRPAANGQNGTVLTLRADARGLARFDRDRLEAPAGRVTLRLVNPSPVPHNISIAGHGVGKVVGRGGVSAVSAVLRPGTYTFLCTMTGHAQAGMKGTLTIREARAP